MRPLTDEETKVVFEKLTKFMGQDVARLIDRKDERHVFRLHKNRVYYLSETQLFSSSSFARDKLLALGTLFGKFTKSGKFHLTVHCLDFLAQYAKYKVWVKANSEMSFLYGHHVTKAGLGRITEGTPQYGGVVVYSMSDVPLGFGLAAQSTAMCASLEPTAIVVLHQGDVGEYLRSEQEMN
ncbi:60S ribosome subunit biogenesis protein NIP7 homolog [Durusdinium trenchii]|uniref:60S ribosome subunit biogenesis protein NIP7 homolog n=1 Tax=Durusdinium trenchii TaxID=1381693 RepID=A0ABP0HIB3_9DINO